MNNVITLLMFLALVIWFGWLAARARHKLVSVVLAGSLAIVVALGYAIALSEALYLDGLAGTPQASDKIDGATPTSIPRPLKVTMFLISVTPMCICAV